MFENAVNSCDIFTLMHSGSFSSHSALRVEITTNIFVLTFMKVHLCWYKYDLKLKLLISTQKYFPYLGIFQTMLRLSSARVSLSQVVTFGTLDLRIDS